jgi:hypothetical protein
VTETRNNGKEKTEKGEKVDENLHYAFIGGGVGELCINIFITIRLQNQTDAVSGRMQQVLSKNYGVYCEIDR